jgi:hypothetical protein
MGICSDRQVLFPRTNLFERLKGTPELVKPLSLVYFILQIEIAAFYMFTHS